MLVMGNSISVKQKEIPCPLRVLEDIGRSEYLGQGSLWRRTLQVHTSSQDLSITTGYACCAPGVQMALQLSRETSSGCLLRDGPWAPRVQTPG